MTGSFYPFVWTVVLCKVEQWQIHLPWWPCGMHNKNGVQLADGVMYIKWLSMRLFLGNTGRLIMQEHLNTALGIDFTGFNQWIAADKANFVYQWNFLLMLKGEQKRLSEERIVIRTLQYGQNTHSNDMLLSFKNNDLYLHIHVNSCVWVQWPSGTKFNFSGALGNQLVTNFEPCLCLHLNCVQQDKLASYNSFGN